MIIDAKIARRNTQQAIDIKMAKIQEKYLDFIQGVFDEINKASYLGNSKIIALSKNESVNLHELCQYFCHKGYSARVLTGEIYLEVSW